MNCYRLGSFCTEPTGVQFMMAHSNVVKSKVAQHRFSLLDHVQLLLGDRFPIRYARAEAGHLRFVRGGQAELGGNFANFSFGQPSFLQWRTHLKLLSRLSAWPNVSDIAGIFSVSDDRKTELLRQWS